MSNDKVFLNEYGELIDFEESTSRSIGSPKQMERRCNICGRKVDMIYHYCRGCNDGRAYCSDSCFDQHRRRDHYEEEYCSECGSRLAKRYSYSSKLNSALGKECRFCNEYCLDRFRHKNVCAECGGELPNTYRYADDINRAMGKRLGFCSSYCVKAYRKKNLCAQCDCKLPRTYTYADDVDRAIGERVSFCSGRCLRKYRITRICAECDRELPSTYKYCRWCGDRKYRFCGDYCCDRHRKHYHS